MLLVIGSAAALFIGTGYNALDTAFDWTGQFESSYRGSNRKIGLYVLYRFCPLIFLTVYFVLESVLVLKVLGERKPMVLFGCGGPLCDWPDFQLCHIDTHLQANERQD
jgi:hypothetical protein